MTRPGARHDAGMHAVARVRAVREQDSRIGLRHALAEQREHESRVTDLRHRLEGASRFDAGSSGSFVALRESLDALGTTLRAAEEERVTSCRISEAAYEHWQAHRARLAAVEALLDRRAAARRAEAARREARELDEISAQLWLLRAVRRGDKP